MRVRTPISRCSARALVCAASLLVPAMAGAQTPWTVTLTPTLNPLPAGFCAAIRLTVFDATGKDVPRNPQGYRVTMADFDISVSGSGVAAHRIDSTHWDSCACQGAAVGSTATVTASYPAQALAANARVPGVAFQRQATFTIAPPKGTANPPACSAVSTPAAPPVGVALPPAFPPVAVAPAAPPVGVALPPAPPPVAVAPPARPVGNALPPPPVAVAPAPPPVGVALPPPPVAIAPSPGAATLPSSIAAGPPRTAPVPVPLNPSGFTAVQTAPGQVRLSWQAVSGASFYGLFGPGLTAGGEKIVGATTFMATNVPAGNQQWAVASFIDPGNISTLASEFPRVALNVTAPAPPATTPPAPPVTSGRYRVVATRFAVGRETIDNVLDQDGKGDEIYGGFSMFHVNRVNGQVIDQDLRRTKVHGQVIDGIDRVAAGSATPNGGLVTGDSYPSAASSAPGGDQTFPFLVWDGTLTNNQDALVLLPSLWESDHDDENFDQWFLSEKNALPVFWWDADMRTALTVLGLNLVTTDTFATGFGFAGLLPLTSKDRPVGLTLQTSGFVLRRRAIVLTREILEAALTPVPANTAESQAEALEKMMLEWNRQYGLAGSFATTPEAEKIRALQEETLLEQPIRARPGESTIAVPLIDASTPNLRGSYILYLRVERVP